MIVYVNGLLECFHHHPSTQLKTFLDIHYKRAPSLKLLSLLRLILNLDLSDSGRPPAKQVGAVVKLNPNKKVKPVSWNAISRDAFANTTPDT